MRIEFKNKIFTGSNKRKSVMDCSIPDNPVAVVVFVHGYKGYKDWGAWNLMQNRFLEQNFGFVKFNMSHNGGTVNEPIDFPDLEAFGENCYSYELNDLNRIVEETNRLIRQECELDIPVYLLGHSRGGGVAILCAATNPLVKKVVSLAGIADIAQRFPKEEELEKWKNEGVYFVKNGRTGQNMPHYYSFYADYLARIDILNIQKAAESLSVPFLQIHGDMDLAVSISEGQQLAAWTDTRIEIIKGAGHTFGAKQPYNKTELPEDLKEATDRAIAFFK